jgi:hypothetical protein
MEFDPNSLESESNRNSRYEYHLLIGSKSGKQKSMERPKYSFMADRYFKGGILIVFVHKFHHTCQIPLTNNAI